ncbi:MAG TPA: FKBP-type peptidyl-prolyl cis-trans isomerase [Flavisolibacter sp.]|jgi:FKBP-type peptidyl-prolyl cis-trans isomerase|nr:FKBP-type peptidyl-prolyl cis-trans isomerase [Flavisolibacter sp.]
MQILKTLVGIASAAALLTACNNVDFKKTKSGIPYKVFSSNKGDSIKPNYIVKFQVIQRVKDSVLYSSYAVNQPQYLQVQPSTTPSNYMDIKGNIMELLPKLRKGDSVYMTQSTDTIFKQNPEAASKSTFKKGDQIITTLRIEDVYKTPEEANEAYTKDAVKSFESNDKQNQERFRKDTMVQASLARDSKIIENYLASKNIQAKKTDWGIYVQELAPGSGPKPAPGKFASVRYNGMNLEGQTFDSGVYPIQVGMGGSIKGFEEGVRQLSKGGKARIYIPSILGYGPQGSPPKIQPNQILVFDMELLDITDKQPAPQAQPNIDTTQRQ